MVFFGGLADDVVGKRRDRRRLVSIERFEIEHLADVAALEFPDARDVDLRDCVRHRPRLP